MIKDYTFFDGGTIKFDDTKSVKELISYAFDSFEYYEPFGMDVVTIFQPHHPDTNVGWFTTNVNFRCADEIKNCDELCFAYHLPDVFYFAEGGWGHHMPDLGNHPNIPDAVQLHLRFDKFDNTVMINGNYSFNDVINALKKVEYIPFDANNIKVLLVGHPDTDFTIPTSSELMDLRLADFMQKIYIRSDEIRKKFGAHIYYEVFEIVY